MKKSSRARNIASPKPIRRLKLPEFSHSLPMLLLRGREAVMRHFRPSLLENGVTEQQWRVLRALSSVEEMEVMVLADATYLLPPSLSRILKDMQRRGLVARRTHVTDLRRNLVAITPKGYHLLDTLAPRSEEIYTEIARRFGDRNFSSLQRLLRKLEYTLDAGAPEQLGKGAGTPSSTVRRVR
jgi:homoprotocatechuate degradation regulator HpaR